MPTLSLSRSMQGHVSFVLFLFTIHLAISHYCDLFQCLGLNLAYNEVSFFLTVLLPKFRLHLAPEYQPEGSAPRAEWKKDDDKQMGRVRFERIWPLSSVTMYVKVRSYLIDNSARRINSGVLILQ
jgi:hypothetical protein